MKKPHAVTYKYVKSHGGFDGQCDSCTYSFYVPARGGLEAAADAAQRQADWHTKKRSR